MPKSHRHEGGSSNGAARGSGGGGRQAARPNGGAGAPGPPPLWTSADVEGDRELMTALTMEKVRA